MLILGGTREARRLAAVLVDRPGLHVTSSLAGRVRTPSLPPGEVRIGGFGGVDGLAGWLRDKAVDAVVDATHPFAARMSANAAAATARAGVALLVLRRPGWTAGPGDDWRWADTLPEAAALLPSLGERIFLTTGRQDLASFADLDLWFLVRSVDAPEPPAPQRMHVLLDRGPFTVDGERTLLREHRIDVLVTKDSGGDMTAAKLVAARELGIPVVIQSRPPLPAGVTVVPTVAAAADWVVRHP
ncbi:cobalt-precorrin-6A reductase [Pseudonocardia sp. K10HN5]|uniref:Cobalt-precorrin-6A reductase n=1 Tax=Pseudonocardia acidicola TaxID=2724939 RepID=A0ABX1SC48_9PSEU|nr:cobalt-precorrin-6A reductase [Pseudonocardia acidicola]